MSLTPRERPMPVLAYSTTTGRLSWADMVARIATARASYVPGPACPTATQEMHEAGEFPLTCAACHLVADA